MKSVEITYINPDDAHPTLKKEIKQVAERVQRGLGFPLPPIEVEISCFFATKDRHFAAQEGIMPAKIYFCGDLIDQPKTRRIGIIAHEFGHVLQNVERELTGDVDQEDRDYEQDCDFKIESVAGYRIYYDDDLLQRSGPGARGTFPRPRGLK